VATELLERLLALHPRELHVLRHVAFENGSVESLAAKYAISNAAAQTLLSRALRSLEGLPPSPDAEERPAAFLAADGQLAALRENQVALEAGLKQAELQAAQTPWRRHERVLRWIAIIVIVVLSAYFWLQDRERERAPQRRPIHGAP
jgi:hypothetical protein